MLHRRSVFLINRKFQLRFAFYVCSWLIGLSFIYPVIIANLFDYLIRYMALDPMGPALAHLIETRQELLWLLLTMQLVLVSLTFMISIFMSHKIAGPLYKLNRFFKEAAEGNIEQPLSFRKRDYFSELVPAYNQMMTNIRVKMGKNTAVIQTATAKIEKISASCPDEIKTQLNEVLSILQTTQKS